MPWAFHHENRAAEGLFPRRPFFYAWIFREGQAAPVCTMVKEKTAQPLALVIAANADLQQLITAILKLDNFRVDTAADDESAYQSARAETPDVIIALADKDHERIDLCQLIRDDRQLAATPLVLLTSCGSSQSYTRYFADGYDQVLPIPFKCSQLLEVVHKAGERNSRQKEGRIRVMYHSGQAEFVTPSRLNDLLANKELLCFQRKDGVATIGRDPIRCFTKADYQGPERRSQAS